MRLHAFTFAFLVALGPTTVVAKTAQRPFTLQDLYRLKTDKQLSFGERRMLDTARGLIVKEIAIARAQTEDQVRSEIESIFVAN